jgi:hypothetical protein
MSPSLGRRSPSFRFLLAATLALTSLATLGVSPAHAGPPKIAKATFARGVTEDFKAKDPTTEFQSKDTVYLLLKINGRPKKGKVESRWMFRGSEIAKAEVDLATINKGVLFAFGEDSYVKFFFTPGKDGLPFGQSYAVEVRTDGVLAGTYPFLIVPPKNVPASKISKATLSSKEGGPAMTKFAPGDTVYLNFVGDFGVGTWLEASWKVNGKVDPAAIRSLTLEETKLAVPGNFSNLPPGGWPKGPHSVTLVMNDRTVGTYQFTIA